MIVYSLATQSMETGKVDVALYLTELQAYKALADDLIRWNEAGGDDPEGVERLELLKIRLHAEGVTAEIVKLFHVALDEGEITAVVGKHEHPWTFLPVEDHTS